MAVKCKSAFPNATPIKKSERQSLSKRLDIINWLAEGEYIANICQEHHVQFSIIMTKLKKVQSQNSPSCNA